MLDARNIYEVRLGTFRGARTLGLDHFREFPAAANGLPANLKFEPVVTFCTGGIRCEKAAPLLEMAGFTNLFQLDGGILNYFEECGGEHYEGDCFVFDKRVALDTTLRETGAAVCFICQTPLTISEQEDPPLRGVRLLPALLRSSPLGGLCPALAKENGAARHR